MAVSSISITKTLVNEGGFQNDPQDKGNWTSGQIGVGELLGTKYGITCADLIGVNIEDLTIEEATNYYAEHYWKPLYNQINSQDVADKLFDTGVLMGVGEAVLLLQMTLGVNADGVFGVITLAALNDHDPDTVLKSYKTNIVTHAVNIANAKPEERKFLSGWIKRINS